MSVLDKSTLRTDELERKSKAELNPDGLIAAYSPSQYQEFALPISSFIDGTVNPTDTFIPVNSNGTFIDSSLSEEAERIVSSKPLQTTENSLFYGETLKSNVIGQEVGYEDLISGNSVVNPFRIFNTTNGTQDGIRVTNLEDISGKPDNGFVPFQPIDTDTLVITDGNPLVANFTNITTAFVSAQRVRGLSGKMTWKIESPSGENPSEFLTVFDGMDYDFFADFDNPNIPPNEFEIFYPFDIGYRAGQVLRLTFSTADGNPVEVLGDSVSMLPYFSTRFQEQTFDEIYPTDDTLTDGIHNWSSQKIQSELDGKTDESPQDDKQYTRKNGLWVENNSNQTVYVPTGNLTATDSQGAIDELESNKLDDAPIDGNMYSRKSGAWVQDNALDTTYDNSLSGLTSTNVKDAIDELQDIKVEEAPVDNNLYARRNEAWEQVVPPFYEVYKAIAPVITNSNFDVAPVTVINQVVNIPEDGEYMITATGFGGSISTTRSLTIDLELDSVSVLAAPFEKESKDVFDNYSWGIRTSETLSAGNHSLEILIGRRGGAGITVVYTQDVQLTVERKA